MPAGLLALIPALITAGTTAYSAVESSNQRGDAAAQLKQQQQQQANQQSLQRQQAIAAQRGTAQEQTGGSLTNAGTQAFLNQLAGYPGFSGSATPSTTAGGQPDISSILATLTGGQGTISGGSTAQPQTQQGQFGLSNPVI